MFPVGRRSELNCIYTLSCFSAVSCGEFQAYSDADMPARHDSGNRHLVKVQTTVPENLKFC